MTVEDNRCSAPGCRHADHRGPRSDRTRRPGRSGLRIGTGYQGFATASVLGETAAVRPSPAAPAVADEAPPTGAAATTTPTAREAAAAGVQPAEGFREVLPESPEGLLVADTTSVAEVVSAAEPTPTPSVPVSPRQRERDRYIDVLRVLALGRVVLYHLVGWAWLTIVFPSMGVMFALAGSLTAASLDRQRGRHYVHVLRRRMRRLLPPFWAFAAVLIPAMFVLGWTADDSGNGGPDWGSMIYWILPLEQPAGSAAASSWTVPLWYISTYLWLLVLSPALLWMFRRWPLKSLLAPVLIMGGVTSSVLLLWGPFQTVLLNLFTYAACWMLGFAHHDGRIRSLPKWKVIPVGLLLAAAGLLWAIRFPDPESGVNLTDIPMATTLYSLGIVLILLRLYVDMSWLTKVPVLDGLVAAVNRRALTIYLWGNICIDLALLAVQRYVAPDVLPEGSALWVVVLLSASWAIIWLVVLGLGAVEDLAAGRRPRINPLPPRESHRDSGTARGARAIRLRRPGRALAAVEAGAAS